MALSIVIFIIILYAPFSSALSEYTQTGSNNSYFSLGNGRFNDQFNAVFGSAGVTSALLNAGKGIPIVADLDNDGINEIIVLDGQTVKLFHNKELNPINSFTLTDFESADQVSNMISFDIDGDGKKNVIIASNTTLYILNFTTGASTTTFTNRSSFNIHLGGQDVNGYGAGTSVGGEQLIACSDRNKCMLIQVSLISSGANTNMYATSFNVNKTGNYTKIAQGKSDTLYCFPRIRDMQIQDYDSDGTKEFIFSYVEDNTGASKNENMIVDYLFINMTAGIPVGNVVNERRLNKTLAFDTLTSNCKGLTIDETGEHGLIGRYISSPLVFDAVIGGQLETVVALARSSNEYIMEVFDSSGNSIDTHPSQLLCPACFKADGEILSNPVKMAAFSKNKAALSDKATEYCVIGQRDDLNQLDLLCGSQVSDINFIDSAEFFFNYSNYDIIKDYGTYTNILHAVKESTALVDGQNLDEILTPYGVLAIATSVTLCPTQIAILNDYCINKIFTSPVDNAAMISVDAEKNGLEDFLALTSTNLYYIDDKFTNSPPVLTRFTVSPCLDRTWKQNTSVQVSLTSADVDGDKVSYRIIGYQGGTNEQDSGFSANVSSGTAVTLSFKANTTIGAGILQLITTDVNDFTGHISTTDLTFSVSDTGAVLGDCTTVTTPTTPSVTGAGNLSLIPAANNLVVTGLGEINSFLGIGLIAIWLLIMVLGDVYLIIHGKEIFKGFEGKYIFAIISGLDLTWIILGAIFSVIPFWLILLIILISIAIFVLYITNKVNSSQGV